MLIPVPKDLTAVQNYLLVMMLALIPVLFLRYVQNRDQKPTWFRRLSWTPFPIFAVLYIVIFADNYFVNRVQVNQLMGTGLVASWFVLMVLPAAAWSVVAAAMRVRKPEDADKVSARHIFYFLTVVFGIAVLPSLSSAADWRPAFGVGLVVFAVLLIMLTLSSHGFNPKIVSSHWRKQSQQTHLSILTVVGILALMIALMVFMTYPPPPPSYDAILLLLGCGILLLLYQGILSIQSWRDKKLDQETATDIAQGADLPEHYTIGDDGQIVERKPERKRSKKPHPH